MRWLVRSREHTNFTYELDPLSMEYLSWFISGLTDRPVTEIRSLFDELARDSRLAEHIERLTTSSARRWLTDARPHYGRRYGWYALIRVLKPTIVVEAGTDAGIGACVMAAALMRNGAGRLITVDTNPASGSLIRPPYDDVVERVVGDSVEVLKSVVGPVDVFVHDSLHTRAHELAELSALRRAESCWVISDNAHATDALSSWAEQAGMRFAFFREKPSDHWYPGGGIGVAWSLSTKLR